MQASTSGRPSQPHGMPPARPPQTLFRAPAHGSSASSPSKARRAAANADEQPGRVQSYVLREVLEARTATEAEGKQLDLQQYVAL